MAAEEVVVWEAGIPVEALDNHSKVFLVKMTELQEVAVVVLQGVVLEAVLEAVVKKQTGMEDLWLGQLVELDSVAALLVLSVCTFSGKISNI